MKALQAGLDLLLTKYSVDTAAVISEDGMTVTVEGTSYPTLPWEGERRFFELRTLATARLGKLCTYRIGHTAPRGTDLLTLLSREAGVVEYTLSSRIKEVFAIRSENAMNVIAETENGCVCTLELAATLEVNTPDIDKHEIITGNGVACDRVVDTQMPQSSIYVRGRESVSYTDTDFELFGYGEGEIPAIRRAFALAKDPAARAAAREQGSHLAAVVAAAERSLAGMSNEKVEGM